MNLAQLGDIPPGAPEPMNVTGELDLTQAFGPLDNGTYLTRGYYMTPPGVPYFSNASQVRSHHELAFRQLCRQLCSLSVSGLHQLTMLSNTQRLCISELGQDCSQEAADSAKGAEHAVCLTCKPAARRSNTESMVYVLTLAVSDFGTWPALAGMCLRDGRYIMVTKLSVNDACRWK